MISGSKFPRNPPDVAHIRHIMMSVKIKPMGDKNSSTSGFFPLDHCEDRYINISVSFITPFDFEAYQVEELQA